jgi:hypothetical protein
MGVGALDVARAETVQSYQQAALEAAPKSGEPVLIFVEASRFSTCAKKRSIFQQLYPTPEFAHLGVFDGDFNTRKPLLQQFGGADATSITDERCGRVRCWRPARLGLESMCGGLRLGPPRCWRLSGRIRVALPRSCSRSLRHDTADACGCRALSGTRRLRSPASGRCIVSATDKLDWHVWAFKAWLRRQSGTRCLGCDAGTAQRGAFGHAGDLHQSQWSGDLSITPLRQCGQAGQGRRPRRDGPERMALVRPRRLCCSARTQEGQDGSQQIICSTHG